ncbi:MAG: hypothetical protein AAGA10_24105 [Bacteroidota bacterium]
MKLYHTCSITVYFLFLAGYGVRSQQIFQLHPENPHYFSFRGEPTVLISSAEHYGAVINTAFDYQTYLKTLHEEGMNYTRIFTGSYVEIPGAFGIGNNTLAPSSGKFLAPWKRVDEPGQYEGESKFDLTQWEEDYFSRLKAFVELAGTYDIIVEVTLFSSIYQDSNWERNPFNPKNNINPITSNVDWKKANTLDNGGIFHFQKSMVAKIVKELSSYDNVFYELQNEPWSDDPQKVLRILRTLEPQPGTGDWFKWAEEASQASLEWQKALAQVIVDTEKNLPQKHLIAQNYTNFKYALTEVDPNISILNFHYAWPETIGMNYAWDRPIGFDESGFAGSSDTTYLRQAWQFLLSGGATFNNLDYSFFVGKEDGTGLNQAPGGGSPALRKQLGYLATFMQSLDYVKMQPDPICVYQAPGREWHAISEKGKQYAIILSGNLGNKLQLDVSPGEYSYSILSPLTGMELKSGKLESQAGLKTQLDLPKTGELLAVRIKRL